MERGRLGGEEGGENPRRRRPAAASQRASCARDVGRATYSSVLSPHPRHRLSLLPATYSFAPQEGTHQELMARPDGAYRRLALAQAAGP